MSKRSDALQFSKETIEEIFDREKGCFFCKRGIHMDKVPEYQRHDFDAMHIVNKSQGGLGVKENGVEGCRGHHHLLDNSEYNHEMRTMAEDYLSILYPGWTRESVTYNRWQGFAYRK